MMGLVVMVMIQVKSGTELKPEGWEMRAGEGDDEAVDMMMSFKRKKGT